MNQLPELVSANVNQRRLNTVVTEDFLEQVETELADVYCVTLQLLRRRLMLRLTIVILIFGLMSLSFYLLLDGVNFYSMRASFLLILFLTVMVISWKNGPRHDSSAWHAKRCAKRLLKAAWKAAPYNAEYHLMSDFVAYYRMSEGISNYVWTRKLDKYRIDCSGFTLFYKKENSTHPSSIILHESSSELIAYFDGLGIRPLSRVMVDDFDTEHADENKR